MRPSSSCSHFKYVLAITAAVTENQTYASMRCRKTLPAAWPGVFEFRECPDTDIACYNMLDPKSSMLKNVLFSGSYQSYNERVIGLSKHCLS